MLQPRVSSAEGISDCLQGWPCCQRQKRVSGVDRIRARVSADGQYGKEKGCHKSQEAFILEVARGLFPTRCRQAAGTPYPILQC
jgi:hypothetical protein